MRLHVLQVGYDDAEPVAARVARVAAWVRSQRGADLIVLPELWAPAGMAYATWPQRAEPLTGPTFAAIAAAAAQVGAYVHAGSIIEGTGAPQPDVPSPPPGQPRNRWNTSALFGPDGTRLAVYRKIHRFGFGRGEPALLDAGTELVAADLTIGPGRHRLRVGLATCYDLRFPELFRGLLDRGCELFVVPAAWPAARREHWQLLGRARAVENQAIMVQCNTAGTHAGVPMAGHSQVVAADGQVLAEAGEQEECLVLEIDLAAPQRLRRSFPVLADRCL